MNRRRFLTLIAGGKKKPFDPNRFVLLVDSEESGVSGSDQFEIRGAQVSTGTTFPVRFSPEADPFDFTDVTVDVSDPTITFPTAGKYFVQIGGAFQRIEFDDGGDRLKLLEIVQWGDLTWSSFENAFFGCNLTSLPNSAMTGDFSAVTSLVDCFRDNNLSELPNNLFLNLTELVSFERCFRNNNLTELPAGLFKYNTKAEIFRQCFILNSINSLPAGLFDNNTLANDFNTCFRNNNITSLPAALFNNNIEVNDFGNCFRENTINTADLSRLYCELSVFNLNENVSFDGGEGNYDPALNFVVDGQTVNTGDARDVLAIDRGWSISDGGAI